MNGSREIGFTIVSMTLSLVAVFIPILFMGGILGRLFQEFAVTIGAAILISGLISLTLTPMLCSRFLRTHGEQPPGRLYEASENIYNRMLGLYKASLTWFLDHRRLTMLFLLVVAGLSVWVFRMVPKGFIPSEDRAIIYGPTEAAEGISFEAMKRLQQTLAEIVRQDPNVEAFMSNAGSRPGGIAGGNTGTLFLRLKPRHERELSADEVIQKLRPALGQVPGIRVFLQNPPAILATFAYAFAFSQIYERPITRIAASRWIYQNIPGPINLPIQTGTGIYNQIIPFPYDLRVSAQLPYSTIFTPKAAGELSQIYLPDVRDDNPNHETRKLSMRIDSIPAASTPLAQADLSMDLSPTMDGRGKAITLDLDRTIQLDPGKTYNLTISLAEDQPVSRFDRQVGLFFDPSDGTSTPFAQSVQSAQTTIYPYNPVVLDFQAQVDGTLSSVFLANPPGVTNNIAPKLLGANLQYLDQNAETAYSDVTVQADPLGRGFFVFLSAPPPVTKGEEYRLILAMEPQGGAIALSGLNLANEGEWDDGLPLRMDGNDGFGGIYPGESEFQYVLG